MSVNIEAFCKKPGPVSKGGLNMGDIVNELKKRNLDTKGNRTELVQRLCKSLSTGQVKESPVKEQPKQQVKKKPVVKKQVKTQPINNIKYKYLESTQDQLTLITRYDPKRRIIQLSGPILRTMSDFVKIGTEYGGMIDINNDGSFDRSIFGIGKKGTVNLSDMMDFEVIFHTHPVGRTGFMFEQPSGSDINLSIAYENSYKSFNIVKYQVHVVFTPEGVYTIYIDKDIDSAIREEVVAAYNVIPAHIDIKTIIGAIETVAKYGVYIFRYSNFVKLEDLDDEPINNWPKSIPLYIDPQEPQIVLNGRRSRHQTQQQRQARQVAEEADRADEKVRNDSAKESNKKLKATIQRITKTLTDTGYTPEAVEQWLKENL